MGQLAAEAGQIATGTSTVAPRRGDLRFADPSWADNPLLRRLAQLCLAGGQTLDQLLEDADLGARDRTRVRCLLDNLVEASRRATCPC